MEAGGGGGGGTNWDLCVSCVIAFVSAVTWCAKAAADSLLLQAFLPKPWGASVISPKSASQNVVDFNVMHSHSWRVLIANEPSQSKSERKFKLQPITQY